jgi:pilus assembly protein CpaB
MLKATTVQGSNHTHFVLLARSDLMTSKTLILMVVAIGCGLAAAWMTHNLFTTKDDRVQILVAKQRFNSWTPIKSPEDMFEPEDRPKGDVPKDAVYKYEAAKDHVLVKSMDKGDPLLATNMVDKNKGGLEVVLPPGKRAVAVRTTAQAVAGGFVFPGSHVDVLHTTKRGDSPESRVVLQNILVRAVDQAAMKPEDKPGLVPATVTLEVTPQQALVLARVQDYGTITLALRPYGDDRVDNTEYAAAAPPPPPPPPVKAPEPPKSMIAKASVAPVEKKSMIIHNGSQWTRATFFTQNGLTHTTVEHSNSDSYSTSAPVSAPPKPAVHDTTVGSK